MGSRARDTQRQRVYSAEAFALSCYYGAGKEGAPRSVAEQEEKVREISHSRYFLSRFGANPRARIYAVTRSNGQGGGSARVSEGTLRSALGGGIPVLLHKIAHFCVPAAEASHGPYFTRALLDLVDRFLPPDAGKRLRAEFKIRKVKVRRVSALETRAMVLRGEILDFDATERELRARRADASHRLYVLTNGREGRYRI